MPIKSQIVYKGKVYKSINILAEELKIPLKTLKSRRSKGWPQERWGEKKYRVFEFHGKEYPTLKALAKELDIPQKTLKSRRDQGWPQERWGEKDYRVIQFQGKEYPT